MLLQLRIENLATIKEIDVEFNKGFSILTGETGASGNPHDQLGFQNHSFIAVTTPFRQKSPATKSNTLQTPTPLCWNSRTKPSPKSERFLKMFT